MFKQIALWVAMLTPSILVEVFCYILTPVIALFTTTEERTDRVKRMGNVQVTMPRTYLQKWCRWFQTHDNAVDEYWYGVFTEDSSFKFLREATQEQYDNSAFLRYVCRVFWMWRNCAYGFLYNWFGRPYSDVLNTKQVGDKAEGFYWKFTQRDSSFQFECKLPLNIERYISINIGWKVHKGFPVVMYANRILSIHTR